MPPSISVVVVTKNEGNHLKATVTNVLDTLPRGGEVVVVDDGSTDGSSRRISALPRVKVIKTCGLGVANARNFGASRSSGDVIVFCDAHMRVPRGWHRGLLEPLETKRVGAVAPGVYSLTEPRRLGYGLSLIGPELHARWRHRPGSRPAPVPVVPGCFLAMRRDTFLATGGFDPGLKGLGGNDNEFSVRLWLLGFELLVIPTIKVGHLFRTVVPYQAPWTTAVHNRLRTAFVHFKRQRIVRVIDALRDYDSFPEGLAMVVGADVEARRDMLRSQRQRTDDWFFNKFKLTC